VAVIKKFDIIGAIRDAERLLTRMNTDAKGTTFNMTEGMLASLEFEDLTQLHLLLIMAEHHVQKAIVNRVDTAIDHAVYGP